MIYVNVWQWEWKPYARASQCSAITDKLSQFWNGHEKYLRSGFVRKIQGFENIVLLSLNKFKCISYAFRFYMLCDQQVMSNKTKPLLSYYIIDHKINLQTSSNFRFPACLIHLTTSSSKSLINFITFLKENVKHIFLDQKSLKFKLDISSCNVFVHVVVRHDTCFTLLFKTI